MLLFYLPVLGGFPFTLFASTFNFSVPMTGERQAGPVGPDFHSAETVMMVGMRICCIVG